MDLVGEAETIIKIINETQTAHSPENYFDNLIPTPGHISLADCEFPDCIEDPLQIIRHVLGDEQADWLAYEDNLDSIAQQLELCIQRLQSAGASDVQGDEEGTKPSGGQAIPG